MHRVQGVDEDGSAGDRQAGVERAPAKAVEQRGLGLARETGFSQPRAKLGQTCGIHGLSAVARNAKTRDLDRQRARHRANLVREKWR
jgi:hypothetical protein